MSGTPIYLQLSSSELELSVRARLQAAHGLRFTENVEDAQLAITDSPEFPFRTTENVLLIHASVFPTLLGSPSVFGFEHYLVFSEVDYLVERLLRLLEKSIGLRGVGAAASVDETALGGLIDLSPKAHGSGAQLPIVSRSTLKSSDERTQLADDLAQFIQSLSPLIPQYTSRFADYAVVVQEEFLMNAIWDANPRYAQESRSRSIQLQQEEYVDVCWAFNGSEFAIFVKDYFGTFPKRIVDRCIEFLFRNKDSQPLTVNRDGPGAGLGLYLIIKHCNLFSICVASQRYTEMVAVFDFSKGTRGLLKGNRAFQYFEDRKS